MIMFEKIIVTGIFISVMSIIVALIKGGVNPYDYIADILLEVGGWLLLATVVIFGVSKIWGWC